MEELDNNPLATQPVVKLFFKLSIPDSVKFFWVKYKE